MIQWSDKGDSFIVKDIEKFVELLPQYFKTNNYASFVRQLNMYDFHKIKRKKNQQEFKHPFFRRDRSQDLVYIRRKRIGKAREQKGPNPLKAENVLDQLREEVDMAKQQLAVVQVQNRNLGASNKEIVGQLLSCQDVYEIKLRKVFYMLFKLMHSFNTRLLRTLEIPLRAMGLWANLGHHKVDNSTMEKIIARVEKLSRENTAQSNEIIDQLLHCFFQHDNCARSGFKKPEAMWRQLFSASEKSQADEISRGGSETNKSHSHSQQVYADEVIQPCPNAFEEASKPNSEKQKSEKISFFEQRPLDLNSLGLDSENSSLANTLALPRPALGYAENTLAHRTNRVDLT